VASLNVEIAVGTNISLNFVFVVSHYQLQCTRWGRTPMWRRAIDGLIGSARHKAGQVQARKFFIRLNAPPGAIKHLGVEEMI
jgi:hypothetical protein